MKSIRYIAILLFQDDRFLHKYGISDQFLHQCAFICYFTNVLHNLFLSFLGQASQLVFLCAGLGFVTSLLFVFLVGVFVSSWLGASVIWLGEWFIKRMPFVRHIYSASKQISSAISPGKENKYLFTF